MPGIGGLRSPRAQRCVWRYNDGRWSKIRRKRNNWSRRTTGACATTGASTTMGINAKMIAAVKMHAEATMGTSARMGAGAMMCSDAMMNSDEAINNARRRNHEQCAPAQRWTMRHSATMHAWANFAPMSVLFSGARTNREYVLVPCRGYQC